MTDEATLFSIVAPCPATREAVERFGCPLCGATAADHYPEDADVIRDVGDDFTAWMMSLPRTP